MSVDAVAATIDRVASAAMAHGVPGLAVGAIDGDEQLIRCFGVEDVERQTPVGPDTRFQVGSVSKPVTGILVQQLIAEDRLGLDEPVAAHIPDLELADPEVTTKVTCRHLLGHLAGFEGDFFIDTGDDPSALGLYIAKLREAPQLVPFDWLFSYSNAGFALLGRVVEVLRGMPYEDSARSLVFAPLGMSRTGFGWEASEGPTASGHVVYDDAPRGVRPWRLPRSYSAFGGLVTSIRDLLRLVRFLGWGSDGVLAVSQRERLWEALHTPDKSPWGMGTMPPFQSEGRRIALFGGTAVSQQASVTLLPDESFALAVLANSDRGALAAREISQAVLASRFGMHPPSPSYVSLSSDLLAEYAGRYRAGIYTVDIGMDSEGLWLEAERFGGMDAHQQPRPAPLPRMRLDFVADGRALVRNGPFATLPVGFIRDSEGRVRWMRFYGRLTPRIN